MMDPQTRVPFHLMEHRRAERGAHTWHGLHQLEIQNQQLILSIYFKLKNFLN